MTPTVKSCGKAHTWCKQCRPDVAATIGARISEGMVRSQLPNTEQDEEPEEPMEPEAVGPMFRCPKCEALAGPLTAAQLMGLPFRCACGHVNQVGKE